MTSPNHKETRDQLSKLVEKFFVEVEEKDRGALLTLYLEELQNDNWSKYDEIDCASVEGFLFNMMRAHKDGLAQ